MNTACSRCGREPAAGFATLNDERYCHDGRSPTCYELECRERYGRSVARYLEEL